MQPKRRISRLTCLLLERAGWPMQTGVKLLMRDGAVRVTFPKTLTPEQCAEFLELVQRVSTQQELCDGAAEVAKRRSINIICDAVLV